MRKLIARLVRRDDVPGFKKDKRDGMILGVTMKSGEHLFKRGVVYELTEELDGTIMFKPVGKTALSQKMWAHDIGTLVTSYKDQLFLTEEEYNQL